jgi:heme/copper-type cytochrome/quinol oxidase subunit 3
MSHATTMEHPADPVMPSPLAEGWGKIMMWLFLMSDAMSFAGLLCGYAAVRMGNPLWPVPGDVLDVPLTALNTFILICSSVTMVKAVSAIQRGDQKGLRLFLMLTMLGGTVFLSIQAYEWTHLITHGLTAPGTLFMATFYALTGFHGCHVLGGVIYLGCILVAALRGKYSAQRWASVEIVGLYWHFVDLIWILVFTFVYLL